MPVPPPGSATRAVAGVCLLATVVLGLHVLSPPALAPPDAMAPGTWVGWATSRSPVLVAMALVRLLALALAWYLLATTALHVVAVLADVDWLAAVARGMTTAGGRHVATAVVGAGIMAATPVLSAHGGSHAHATGGGPAAAATSTPVEASSPPSLRRIPSDTPTAASDPRPSPVPARGGGSRDLAPRLTRVEPGPVAEPPEPDTPTDRPRAPTDRPKDSSSREPAPTSAHTTTDTEPDDPGTEDAGDDGGRATPGPEAAERATWTVVAGDHFWGVAEREVARRLGRTPTEREVAGWWRQLVAVNHDRLVDPENPDLILPGQVMRFPTVRAEAG